MLVRSARQRSFVNPRKGEFAIIDIGLKLYCFFLIVHSFLIIESFPAEMILAAVL